MTGPKEKPEKDSRGHEYSWRDLVQRICNLHFKHTLKSVPGRQPRSALTLVAGGPAGVTIPFLLKQHTYTQTRTHKSPDLAVFIALLWLTPLLSLSGSVFMFGVSVFMNDSAKSWSSLYSEKEIGFILAPEGADWRASEATIFIVGRVIWVA